MSEAAFRSIIEFRLKEFAQAQSPEVTMIFDATTENKPSTAYIEFDVLSGNSRRANLGGKRTVRHVGVLQVDCFWPDREGLGRLTRLSDRVGKLFDEFTIKLPDNAAVTFGTPTSRALGKVGEHQRTAVSIPYRRDEHDG